VAEGAQAVARRGRHQHRCHLIGVNDRVLLEGAIALEETDVEANVLPQDGIVSNEGFKVWKDIHQQGGIHDHGVGDTGKVGDEGVDWFARIDQGGKFIQNTVLVEFHRADLNDRVVFRVQTGCFDIQGDNYRHGENYTRCLSQPPLDFQQGRFPAMSQQDCQ